MKRYSNHSWSGLLALALFLLSSNAFANGMFIQEMSGSGMAQASAVVAAGDRPSNAFQNAANLSFLEGIHFEFAGTTYFPTGYFETKAGQRVNVESNAIFTPHAFFSWKINDWLAIGVAEFVDFGLKTVWPDDWDGRHIVQEAGLESFTINPNISFGPFKGFAIAVGFDAKWGRVDIRRALTLGMKPIGSEHAKNSIRMVGETWGFGGNAGIMFQPAKWVRLGASYRSMIQMKMNDGKADFNVSKPFAEMFPDQKFKSQIDLPHLIALGSRFWPMENLSIELDIWFTLWSSYDSLVFEFEKGLKTSPNMAVMQQTETKDYHNAMQVRLGGEYVFYNDHLKARLGFLWDGNPAPDHTVDPMLPDSERFIPTVGFGVEWWGVYVDVAYMTVINLPRDTRKVKENPLPGKFAFVTHDLTFSIGYHFDPFDKEE